jgi:hypothetical protein
MMGKSLRKLGRDKQPEQHKKSAYIGKEEVQDIILVHLEAGLVANRTCAGEQEYRGRVWCGDRKRIGCREVPSIYQCAHRNCISPLKYWDQKCH